jgi:hypothetical protein
MRKPVAASVTASKVSVPASPRDDALQMVCLALVLALFALALRIATIW